VGRMQSFSILKQEGWRRNKEEKAKDDHGDKKEPEKRAGRREEKIMIKMEKVEYKLEKMTVIIMMAKMKEDK
jgi:hypothetical protein